MAPQGGSIEIPGGLTLSLPPGAVTPGSQITYQQGNPGDAALLEMESAGPAVEIEVADGELVGLATITFAVPPRASDDEVPVIATWNGTRWEPVASTYDPATSTVSVVTDHLSWWKPWTWNIGKIIKETLNTVFGDVDTSEISCSDSDNPGDYQVTLTNQGSAFGTCVTTDGDNIFVTIKNRRRGAFVIELPEGWTGEVFNAANLSTMLTESLFNMSNRRFVVVPGGETVQIRGRLEPGQRINLPVDQDLFSWSIDSLLFAASVYSVASGKATDTVSSVVRQVNDDTSKLSDALECLAGNNEWMSAALDRPNSSDAAESLVPTIWRCAKALAREGAIGVIATIINIAMSPIRQIFKLGEMAVDLATGNSNRQLKITRARPPATTAPVTTPPLPPADTLTADDVANARMPSICGFAGGTLIDGELPISDPDLPEGSVTLVRESFATGDLDGDGSPEIAVVFACTGGGVAWPQELHILRQDLTPIGFVDLPEVFPHRVVDRAGYLALSFNPAGYLDASVGLDSVDEYQEFPITISITDGRVRADVVLQPGG